MSDGESRKEMNLRYKVGDRVIVSRPELCVYGCTASMRALLGKEVLITRADLRNPPRYKIEGSICNWTDDCFDLVVVPDLPDFYVNESIDILFT